MVPDDVRKLLLRQPFQPFDIHLVDGRTFRVSNREFVATSKSKSSITLMERDGQEHIVNMLTISTLTPVEETAQASGERP